MSTATRHTNVSDDDPDVEQLLECAADRVTVERVLEYVRGERPASHVKCGDWLAAIEHVRDETGEDLVLYSECDGDGPTNTKVSIDAVDDKYGRSIRVGWNQFSGYNKPHFTDRNDVEDGLRFLGETGPTILRLDEAKERFQAFVDGREETDE